MDKGKQHSTVVISSQVIKIPDAIAKDEAFDLYEFLRVRAEERFSRMSPSYTPEDFLGPLVYIRNGNENDTQCWEVAVKVRDKRAPSNPECVTATPLTEDELAWEAELE